MALEQLHQVVDLRLISLQFKSDKNLIEFRDLYRLLAGDNTRLSNAE